MVPPRICAVSSLEGVLAVVIGRQPFAEREEMTRMAGIRVVEGILRRKPVEHVEETEVGEGTRLDRSLGLWQLTAIGVGGIIGAGTGGPGASPRWRSTLARTVANGSAGPAVLVSSASPAVRARPRSASGTPASGRCPARR